LNESSNPTSTATSIPTAAQLADARLKHWHQQGEALLTMENLRGWINAAGLVLFAPRPQIASPAGSLVEAAGGAPNATPTLEQIAEARMLLGRLIAEGLAVPLNLLGPGNGTVHAGAPGDTPDFVASTAVFSYVFTLRGDKAWKQPPATTGALKVSQLALAAFEALTRRGALTAYDLATELGKEVTEAAVLRALGELWTHLRALPLAQPDGAATVWELASARFTKQIKAGANAGQPSALSALISLYLGQAVVASEDEIESFLSPLAPRSRVRDVIHALLSGRQLDAIAIEGRTMLYVAGELPAFLAPTAPVAEGAGAMEVAAMGEGVVADAESAGEGASRITKYVPKPRKIGTGYLAKAKPAKFAGKAASFERGVKPGFKARNGAGPAPDRERRPFKKPAAGFEKPWEEEKARRLAAASKPSEVREDAGGFAAGTEDAAAQAPPRAARVYKPRPEGGATRKPFGDKAAFRGKPGFGGKPTFGDKPRFGGEGRPPRRDFAPRAGSEGGDARPPRKTFSKPGTFGRKREGFAAKPAGDGRPPRREFTPRPQGDRPPRREAGEFGARKPFAPRAGGKPDFAKRERPAFKAREREDRGAGGEGTKRVYRKFDAPRDRPARTFDSDRPARAEGSRKPAGDFASRKFASKPSGDFKPRKFAGKPDGDFKPRKFAGKPAGKPGGFARKPGGSFAGKKPAGAGFAGKPTSTFAKFAGGKKPFGKRPPARKFKPKGESE